MNSTPLSGCAGDSDTAEGRALYARRKAVVEPVNGQIKHARRFRQFSLRGIDAVDAEWTMVEPVSQRPEAVRSPRCRAESGLRDPRPRLRTPATNRTRPQYLHSGTEATMNDNHYLLHPSPQRLRRTDS